ncbi:MAG: DUF802 domain-containing protein [Rhodocyclales bacterium]|nr:DUF802 domain-containing protein [Rhodocyclales bacterium]
MNRNLCIATFVAGALAVAWVAIGYLGSHPLALTMTLLIGAVYVLGALELRRFHQATSSLAQALAAIPENLPQLGDWLDRIHPALQNPVRLRIEGERVGLPGPVVTPYLVGLLVMLGMLGTFLGMVVTLNGAVLALESTTDLQTIRSALAAPVKGLGLAFGTSVAGVAASAMLGLISALCRRERLQTGQLLDTKIATALRGFSLTHQRQETFKALQAQSQALPEVVEKMSALMAQMERHQAQLNERLLANQEGFHRDVKGVYGELAVSVDRSLKASLTDSARVAGATIQPVVEATMAGIARETTALHERMAATVAAQLDGLAARFDTTVGSVADTWTAALATHERGNGQLIDDLRRSQQAFAADFAQRSATLLAGVGEAQAALQADLAARDGQRLALLTQSLEALAASLQREWQQAGTQALAQQQQICRTLEETGRSIGEHAQAQASRTLGEIAGLMESAAAAPRAAAEVIGELRSLQADLVSRDEARLAALTQSLESMAAALREEWQQAGAQTLAQQQQICRTLEQTAQGIGEHAQAHASNTINEIARLLQTAAEAPRVAAEVIGQLRQQLSDSIAKDNALLDERSRIMAGLGTLLDAINQSAAEQRGVIDTLVASSAAMLERVGGEFTAQVGAESAKITEVATQVTGSAVEVASLSEAFSGAVQQFGEANDKLIGSLQRIEGALDKSLLRSDEQLAYYVAQAREIIDLSIMSQQRIVADLQQVHQGAGQPAPVAAEAA